MRYSIYNKSGEKLCEVSKITYNGSFMESCKMTCDIKSAEPIPFEIGSYIEYRGERFELNYIPTIHKKGANGSIDAFEYQGVIFNWLADELTRCQFLDYVKYDNEVYYSPLPNYSFFADSLKKFVERIQVNLDRVYKGDKKWEIVISDNYKDKKDANIVVNNINVWGALKLLNENFKINFIIKGRKIVIGGAGITASKLFKYGRGKGLSAIKRIVEPNQAIVTRLRVYGSTKNMPYRYYYKRGYADLSNFLPDNMANANLMLPGFPGTQDVYIDSPNIATLGIREASVFFDGTDGREDIYPTIENMRAEDVRKVTSISLDAGDNGFLDEIAIGSDVQDDGVGKEGKKATFTISLKDLGFDINKHLHGENATISLKTGMCGGREFVIVSCKKVGNKYQLTCNRKEDESVQRYFPYKDYPIKAGDKFVLLNIQMPDLYIETASQRLLDAGKQYLAKNDFVRYSYQPEIDNIELAREHDRAVSEGRESIYQTIKEGDLMLFEDDDLSVHGAIIIDKLTIKEGNGLIPSYEVTLREDKSTGSLNKVQERVESLMNTLSRGYNVDQIRGMINAFGGERFISKTSDDVAEGEITFKKGLNAKKADIEKADIDEVDIKSGNAVLESVTTDKVKSRNYVPSSSGHIIGVDDNGDSYAELDKLVVRKKAIYNELVIAALRHVGGQIVLSPAKMKCVRVEDTAEGYKCYFNRTDGEKTIHNEFVDGDLARLQTFNLNGTQRYFWRAVVGIGDDWVLLSKTDADSGSDEPMAGDEIVQMGNKSDQDRQSVIILSAYGVNSPEITQYEGVNSFSLDGKVVAKLSSKGNIFKGDFINYDNKNITTIINEGASELKDKIDNIKIGGRNLALGTGESKSTNSYPFAVYNLSKNYKFENGEEYTISFDCELGDDRTLVSVYNSGGAVQLINFTKQSNNKYIGSFRWNNNYDQYVANNTFLNIYGYPDSGKSVSKISNLMLVKGNKSVDWTPAPEDLEVKIEENISVVKTELTKSVADTAEGLTREYEKKITEVKEDVADVQRELQGSISRTETTLRGEIQATNTNFTSKIEETKQKIDNIKVGGRNLLRGSTTTELLCTGRDYGMWEKSGNTITVKTDSVWNAYRFIESFITKQLQIGDSYVFSCDILTNKDANIGFELYYMYPTQNAQKLQLKANKKERIVIRGNVMQGDSHDNVLYCLRGINQKDLTITLTNFKLEEGNIPTAWTPAPEDLETKIEDNKTLINQTKNEISLKADKSVTDGLSTRLLSAEQKITADAIKSVVRGQTTDMLNSAVEQTKSSIRAEIRQGDDATKESIKSSLTMTDNGISLLGKELELNGTAVFTSLDKKLGKTLIKGGFINTELIKADEIESKKLKVEENGNVLAEFDANKKVAKIGGFEVDSNSQLIARRFHYGSQKEFVISEMLLNERLLRFIGKTYHNTEKSQVFLGDNVMPSTIGATCSFRIHVNEKQDYGNGIRNIGIYIDVQNANTDFEGSNNHALYIANGNIKGLRYSVRRISQSTTLDAMDTVIIVTKPNITINLPEDKAVEDGQFYIIQFKSSGHRTQIRTNSSEKLVLPWNYQQSYNWTIGDNEKPGIQLVYNKVDNLWHVLIWSH